MSDNKNDHNETDQYIDEEYHFAEEPDMTADSTTEDISNKSIPGASPQKTSRFNVSVMREFFNRPSPARNAIVVLGVIIFLLMLYKLTSGIFSSNKELTKVSKAPYSQITQVKPATTVPRPMPIQTQQQPLNMSATDIENIKQKIASMEQNQTKIEAQFAATTDQMSNLNTNLNMLTEKIAQLNQQMLQVSTIVQEQAQRIVVLTERAKARPKIVKHVVHHPAFVKYYLQAVIPGRAWLIATNGSTLTVRVGTIIPGYGMVKFIDAIQGQILTSTGQMIRFSQNDS